ncbi:hypothetical protein FRC10_002215 [Ceratobasidium sp. 414]|nr:hypothetical protein FRC10_002215 [Ceratobasidium sp. 414]
MLHIANISEDVLIHIASHLELDDLWRLRQVWRTAGSRLGLLMGNLASATAPWSLPDTSELPASLVRDTIRAARVDRRWSAARPCEYAGYPSPDDATWAYVRLADGQWVLCTDERGDVTATHLARVISPCTQRPKAEMVFESDFDPYCAWSGPVGWFRSPAVLIAQLKGDFRRDLAHEPRLVFLSVWRWGPDEEHTRHSPWQIMRTAPFEAKDCEFRVVESIRGPHVLVVRAGENATHFEFYDLPGIDEEPAPIEPEPQIPVAGASLPLECHQITLPQSGSTGAGHADAITALICVARSPRNSELMAYRILFDGRTARLSFLGGSRLPEYFDVVDCVLGERGVRGVASIAAPRRDTRVTLALLTCDNTLTLRTLEHPMLDSRRPMRLAFDELRATVVFLDFEGDMHTVLFDPDLGRDLRSEHEMLKC